jgi:hypothetical protein
LPASACSGLRHHVPLGDLRLDIAELDQPVNRASGGRVRPFGG